MNEQDPPAVTGIRLTEAGREVVRLTEEVEQLRAKLAEMKEQDIGLLSGYVEDIRKLRKELSEARQELIDTRKLQADLQAVRLELADARRQIRRAQAMLAANQGVDE